ncbi:hypothetical protein A9K66_10770 [Mesorhizobium sp. AA23]|nr:hypothetical protein A9K66_10770 [Mesorhizobium sp. AA23]
MAKRRDKIFDKSEFEALRQLLFDIEPELKMLEGAVAILQSLSTTADQIEPIALAPARPSEQRGHGKDPFNLAAGFDCDQQDSGAMNVRGRGRYRAAPFQRSGLGAGLVARFDASPQLLLLAVGGISLFAKQFGWVYLQNLRDLLDRLQARIVAAPFERADVGPIEVCPMGKSFLRQLFCIPGCTKILSKKLPYVHRT